MGLGQHPAGVGPFGFDPPADPSEPVPFVEPQAAFYNLGTRDVPIEANGLLKQMHPVDQAMQLAIGMRRGTWSARRNDGLDLEKFQRLSPQRKLSTVIVEVNHAARDLIKNNDVRVELVELLDSDVRGRFFFVVHYFNLRDPNALKRAPEKVRGSIG